MKIDPFQLRYLRLASGDPEGSFAEKNIEQVGESIQSVATPFELIPEFQRIRL